MPVVKNQYERLKKINDRLNSWGGKPVSKADLLRLCECSERTLRDDLQLMRDDYEAPIEYNRQLRGYHYTHPFDLAASVALTNKDLTALHTAVATLNQFQHLSLFEGLRGTVDKIDKAVRFRSSQSDDYGQHILFDRVAGAIGSIRKRQRMGRGISARHSSAKCCAVRPPAVRYGDNQNAPALSVRYQGTPQSVVRSRLATRLSGSSGVWPGSGHG